MTTSTPDIQPAVQHTAQVAIVGAGPVGLMMANYLGQMGISVLVVEKLATLIDYPRAIGIDDESLRAMQAVGLVNDVLPHTTPWHAMRFLTPKGRCFADIQPMTDEFGWSRRNAFIQPQVDAVMYHGLQRFPQVRCLFSREVEAFSQNGDSVTLNLKGPDGERETVRADWLVACDGGASFIRRTLNIPFEGKTAPNQWIVIDIANDPLATPHVYLCCDPVRPYVSAALPHGVRRFEFMVMPGETEAQLSEPHNMRRLLSKVLPDPDRVELIRQRVYTHNARLAERFRIDCVLLAGDAAHIMPVWQGQGYNSGMRDAFNLAWKLALVVNGKAGETLLDSYQQERRDHAKAMIDLSVTAGYVLAPPKRWQGAVRDGLSWLLNYLPPVKRYFLEMRFKPMPQYREGALLPHGVRRFEFMVMPGETEAQLSEPHNMRRLLSKVLPDPDRVELIRQRVYTHNARLAERFRIDCVLLAGDAAHIMPVWQGQGYNSGMRDAFNLAWKLALVVNGKAGETLLDSYQQERRDHAKAMIDLSVTAGYVLAPPKRWQGAVRDGLSWLLNYLPPVKRYFLEMRFKPMPQYREGALLTDGAGKTSPVGKMFIQPQVTLESGESVLLDEVIGANFAIIGWGCNPQWGLDAGQIARWRAIGVRFIQVVPEVQIHREQDNAPGTLRVGDTQNRLKSWFALHNTAIAVVRPDRFVAALAIPQTLGAQLTALAEKLTLATGDTAHAEEKVA